MRVGLVGREGVSKEKIEQKRGKKKKRERVPFGFPHQIITSLNSDFIGSKAKKMLPG